MRFTLVSNNSCNAVTFVDTVSGREYVVMGENEDYNFEELRFIVDLLNTGDKAEQDY